MTGTSMDGIDISLVKTNGKNLRRLNKNFYYKYSDQTKDFLLSILNEKLSYNLQRQEELNNIITDEHYKALKMCNIIDNADLIGFHGQTIHHDPEKKISIQLGDPIKLSKMLKKNVIFDFRTKDIEMGGQGAPLAPIYHQFIIESLKLDLPACILNIGGVSNLTFWDGKTLIGFDTGPGNGLMDKFMKKKFNQYFDQNGNIASKGIPNQKIVTEFMEHHYFKQSPPKSLDRNSFLDMYNKLLRTNLNNQDIMATLADFTIHSIYTALHFVPGNIKNMIISGGGHKNSFLVERLKKKLNIKFLFEDELSIDCDYIESELIAYLSARSLYNLPFTFPSTTGVSKASSGGKIYNYL